jgi:c-di-GMP-binding flagellar brake protein YcgR
LTVENRKYPRYPVELAVEVQWEGETLLASTRNVSVGGVGLVVDRELKEGSEVGLTLFLLQDGIEDPDEEPFEAKAIVAWSAVQDAGTWIAGVRFEQVTPTQIRLLERFLSKLDPG